jgi:hypothetical protein
MVASVTPILGFAPTLSDAAGYWDAGRLTAAGVQINTPALGTTIFADDGHQYVYAKATAAVAAVDTVCILTEPAMTFATGAGLWRTKAANQAIGDVAWLQKTLA